VFVCAERESDLQRSLMFTTSFSQAVRPGSLIRVGSAG
jgi:hypothetical protein